HRATSARRHLTLAAWKTGEPQGDGIVTGLDVKGKRYRKRRVATRQPCRFAVRRRGGHPKLRLQPCAFRKVRSPSGLPACHASSIPCRGLPRESGCVLFPTLLRGCCISFGFCLCTIQG